MDVRSDFKIALKIKDQNGKVHRIGGYQAVRTERDEPTRLPHLLRVHPGGDKLASYDIDGGAIAVHDLGAGIGATEPVRVGVSGIEGAIQQFRWLSGDAGFEVATRDQVYLVPWHAADGASQVDAQPVFVGDRAPTFSVVDTRILPAGIMVRTAESIYADDPWETSGQVYVVEVADDTVQNIESLVPRGLAAQAANIRHGGQVVVALDVDYQNEVGDEDFEPEFWTFAVTGTGPAKITNKQQCGEEGCWVENWTPGTKRIGYADSDGAMIAPPDGEDGPGLRLTLPEDDEGSTMHVLWANETESRYLAANRRHLRLWDQDGTVLKSWTPPRKKVITSAHFDHDGEAVIVAAGTDVYRIANGKARRVIHARGKYKPVRDSDDHDWAHDKRSFVDQPIPLPGGGVAYAVVDLDQSWEEADYDGEGGIPFEMSEPEPEPEQSLKNPFSAAVKN